MAHKYKFVSGIQEVQQEEGTNPLKTSVYKLGNIASFLKLSCIQCLINVRAKDVVAKGLK